jgi:polyvinyl alcohol dehydrogenase (cytochrome)
MNLKNWRLSFLKATFINIVLLSLASTLSAQSPSDESGAVQWQIAGQNLANTWSQPAEHSITPANVNTLSPKWAFTTGGDVSATPTVDGNAVYFPDWAGNLFAVRKDSGRLIWSHKISEYDAVDGAISRVSPAVDGNQLIIGDILSSKEVHNGANVIAVDKQRGTLRWITQVPAA